MDKGIIKDIEDYCFLNYNQIYVDENKKIIIDFSVDCPSTINITKIVGEVNGFSQEAKINSIIGHDIWDEKHLKTYNLILKIDINKCIGKSIKFNVEIEKLFYSFTGLLEIK